MTGRSRNRPRCMALTKAGDQCENRAARDSDYCGSHGPKAGRHTKLTDGLIGELAANAERGLYRTELAELAGVDPRTLYRWLEAGAADEEAGKTSIYTRLRQALARAEARAEADMLDLIRSSAASRTVLDKDGDAVEVDGDWRAAAWFLERRYAARYGARQKIEHGGTVRAGELVDVAPGSDEAALEVARILQRAGAVNVTTTEEDLDA